MHSLTYTTIFRFLTITLLVALVVGTTGGIAMLPPTRAAGNAVYSIAASTDTVTATLTSTATSSSTVTVTPSSTQTSSPTITNTPTLTYTPTGTPTSSQTPSLTPTPTATLPSPAVVDVQPATVVAGNQVTISGRGFLPLEQVDLELAPLGPLFGSLHLAYVQAGSTGSFFAGGITIPLSAPAGFYQLRALGLASTRIATSPLQIIAAQASLTISTNTFAPLDTVSLTGNNFFAGEMVSLTIRTLSGTAASSLAQVQADSVGHFGPMSVQVPFGVPAGAALVTATGQQSNRLAAVAVTINARSPALSLSSTFAKPNETLTLVGNYFKPGETVLIDLVGLVGTSRLAAPLADATGSFTVNATIPATAAEGAATVVATGAISLLSASSVIQIGALPTTLLVSPSSITAGMPVGVTGSGFFPGEAITLQLVRSTVPSVTLATVVADASGRWSIGAVSIPASVDSGVYSVVANGQRSGRQASATLTVQGLPEKNPVLRLIDPAHASGAPYLVFAGGLMQVMGSDFPANSRVVLVLVGSQGATSLGSVTTTSEGDFGPQGITLPVQTPAGRQNLEAQVGGTRWASVALDVVAVAPVLNTSTSSVVPGQAVNIAGRGFAPGEQVELALNGAALETTPTALLVRSDSTFSATFVVPSSLNDGPNTLTASGLASRASASLRLTGQLPIASTFYFPNGDTTVGARTAISLLNTSSASAQVHMTFLYQGEPERTYGLSVAAHAHAQVDLALVAGAGRFVAVIVESTRPIGAASTIYYNGGDSASVLGADAAGTTWYLSEGYTGGSFHEYLEIMNPNRFVAMVDIHFLPFNGRPQRDVRVSLGPRSLTRLDTALYMPRQSFSTIVTADKGIVVARTMRFGLNGRGAHAKIGVAHASTLWLFAHDESNANRQTFLTILNPNQAVPAEVTATFYDSSGRPIGNRTIHVSPLRRGNITLRDVIPGAEAAISVISTVPVVVERPFYVGPTNLDLARSGSDVFGRNGGATRWLFPSFSIANGNQIVLHLFNPSLKTDKVTATLYTTTGRTVETSFSVPPNSHTDVPINALPGLSGDSFGAVLQSTNGGAFVAELTTLNTALGLADATQGFAQ